MSIIYLNKDKDLIFVKNNNVIEKIDSFKFSKNDIITSTIYLSDVINFIFKLPKNTPKEQLEVKAEIYFYENAGLDLTKKYKTNYLIKEIESDSENYIVEAIAITEDDLKTKFSKFIEKTKYIDYISPIFLTFSKFYDLYKKEPSKDAFVYFDENHSFVAIFNEGKYLYSRSLPHINILLKKLNIDYKKFLEFISTKGFDADLYETLEEKFIYDGLVGFFNEYFTNLNNRFSYGRSVFQLDNIDNIYFYTPFEIVKLESVTDFWKLSGVNFEKLHIEKEIPFLDRLAISYNSEHFKDKINFSIFPRPPKIYKTKSFQFIAFIITTLLIFLGHYLYLTNINQNLTIQNNKLSRAIKIKKQKLSELKIKNKFILDKIAEYKKKLNLIETDISKIRTILETSLQYKNSKITKDVILISKLLRNNRLQLFYFKFENNQFTLGVYSETKNRENIAQFINDLNRNHYKNIQTNEIKNVVKIYTSIIRFSK